MMILATLAAKTWGPVDQEGPAMPGAASAALFAEDALRTEQSDVTMLSTDVRRRLRSQALATFKTGGRHAGP
jgi:hypothetical protein